VYDDIEDVYTYGSLQVRLAGATWQHATGSSSSRSRADEALQVWLHVNDVVAGHQAAVAASLMHNTNTSMLHWLHAPWWPPHTQMCCCVTLG
jgi:hypothetical protein